MTFARIFYGFFIFILIVLSVFSFILSYKLDENFFLRFSADKELKESTIYRIYDLQLGFLLGGCIFLILCILAVIFRRYVQLFFKRYSSFFQNFLLLFFTVVFIIIIGEVIMRLMLYNETSEYGFGPGSLRFNSMYVHLNSDGMRDKEFSTEKNKGVKRITGLGDSFTFGAGVKDINDTYLKILEKNLNENGNYEVLNFGLPGLTTKDELNILKNKALKYDPDIIIVGYVLNDFENIDKKEQKKSKQITLPYIGFWLRNFSYLYYFLETRINAFFVTIGHKQSYEDSLVELSYSDINKQYNKEIFEELSSISKERNTPVLIVLFPMIYHFDDYPFYSAHNFIKKISQENNFYVIDLLDYYKGYNEEDLILNKYDKHPNELAHKIAGEAIFEVIKKW